MPLESELPHWDFDRIRSDAANEWNRWLVESKSKVARMRSGFGGYGAELNGKDLERCWFRHSDLKAGGHLKLTLGGSPNKAWGSHPDLAPPSMSPSTALG